MLNKTYEYEIESEGEVKHPFLGVFDMYTVYVIFFFIFFGNEF